MYMLILSGGPYANERTYRVPMSQEVAKRTAQDFRRRFGCRVSIVPYVEAQS